MGNKIGRPGKTVEIYGFIIWQTETPRREDHIDGQWVFVVYAGAQRDTL